MSINRPAWTPDLIARRRDLHSRLDRLGRLHPADAARQRLALYTIVHEFEMGQVDAGEIGRRFAGLETETRELVAV